MTGHDEELTMRGYRTRVWLAVALILVALIGPMVQADDPAQEARGQICRNANMEGPQVHYHDQLNGPPEWWIDDHVGVQREGGVTQPTASQWKDANNSFAGFNRYLQGEFSWTALEMGGAFRMFNWEVQQHGIGVQAGFNYALSAHFHPIVMTQADGREVFLDSGRAGDWAFNLEWRWRVLSGSGQVLAEDAWQNGNSLGTGTFDLGFGSPHAYTFNWVSDRTENVNFSLEFRNLWPIATTKVWLHGVRCIESGSGASTSTTVTPGDRAMQERVGRLSEQ